VPRRSKLTPERLAELEAAYKAWNPSDPNERSMVELAAEFGITKAAVYYWKDRGWDMSGKPARRKDAKSRPEEQSIDHLVDELVSARMEIAKLKRQLDESD